MILCIQKHVSGKRRLPGYHQGAWARGAPTRGGAPSLGDMGRTAPPGGLRGNSSLCAVMILGQRTSRQEVPVTEVCLHIHYPSSLIPLTEPTPASHPHQLTSPPVLRPPPLSGQNCVSPGLLTQGLHTTGSLCFFVKFSFQA